MFSFMLCLYRYIRLYFHMYGLTNRILGVQLLLLLYAYLMVTILVFFYNVYYVKQNNSQIKQSVNEEIFSRFLYLGNAIFS